MSDKKILVLNSRQVQQKINRIAYQLLEDNFEETEIILAGVVARGYRLATRLKSILEEIAPFKITLISIDLDKLSSSLNGSLSVPLEDCSNKVLILVDDVLNSGKALAYAFGIFLNIPLKKIRTVVLVDRNHKSFPIATDFTGLALSTVLKEHVDVVLDENGEEDAVYLR
ncbi:phosphoribosyltransferase family protein [Mucilaginibacter arboris]|uniref:Phosphoribosyltransferase n=1 Tax=Mucilaginibacter arboris TaxID=2682090 RepID=A0A7K1T126_9SPHI|nr:phosphoribosyltransferase family protein [Mucilaginibacter arboris]MVN23255.1 phosphoribosyltransferase [Mucilaginibacter arboris]